MNPEDMMDEAGILESILESEVGDDVEIEVPEAEADEAGLKPKSRGEIESIVQAAIGDAVDFVESEISQDRIKAQRYYDGRVDIGHEDGRSKVVSTKVRDTVRAVKPSLMRVFPEHGQACRVHAQRSRGRRRRRAGDILHAPRVHPSERLPRAQRRIPRRSGEEAGHRRRIG
jgi:hypothetical protein